MYDYVIVGGGSAGCVLAARLSEDPTANVLLIEQGSSDHSPWIHLPVTYYKTAKGNMMTRYAIEPQLHRDGIVSTFVQGRVIGGGSSVNGMVYIRGNPQDYDNWVTLGCPGWSYDEVLPYFIRAESNEVFSGSLHGTSGPLKVSNQRHTHYLTKAWVKAMQELGVPFNADFNSGHQTGVGFYQITAHNGRRCSSAVAYLRPALGRTNLTVHTKSQVLKILADGHRATGVRYVHQGRQVDVRASTEVIVCAGAIGSPHLLLLSGIGPARELEEIGVDVVNDLPGVGQNLQDHVDIFLVYQLNGPHSYDKYKKFRWQLPAGLQYGLFRNGPVSSNIVEGGMFWHTAGEALPDLQYHFLPGAGIEEGADDSIPNGNGCTTNVYQARPRSRGWVKLRSGDPFQPPRVNPNYLGDPYDVEILAEGVRIAQDAARQPSLATFIENPIRPQHVLRSKSEREEFVRKTAQGALHPSGACRIGQDGMAVVDTRLKVHGMEGLRVVDSSVIPQIISGNLNAPVIMIAERAADFIRRERSRFGGADGQTEVSRRAEQRQGVFRKRG